MVMGRHMGIRTRDERGFTLVELMIVVAVLAILAAIAIPSFFRESSKAKHQSEVTAMMGEIAVKLEQFKMESPTGRYIDAPKCPGSPTPAGANFRTSCIVAASVWETLRINPPSTTTYCSYAVTTGTSADAPAPTGFTMAQTATSWWFIIAECDMGNDGGTNATFMVSSIDSKQQKLNVGQ